MLATTSSLGAVDLAIQAKVDRLEFVTCPNQETAYLILYTSIRDLLAGERDQVITSYSTPASGTC